MFAASVLHTLALQLTGAIAIKPDVGDLAFDLELLDSNVSKDDLVESMQPADAAGLPTAQPPIGPSLPQVCNPHLSELTCSVSCFSSLTVLSRQSTVFGKVRTHDNVPQDLSLLWQE